MTEVLNYYDLIVHDIPHLSLALFVKSEATTPPDRRSVRQGYTVFQGSSACEPTVCKHDLDE